jgi:hypothetical protein
VLQTRPAPMQRMHTVRRTWEKRVLMEPAARVKPRL